VRVPSRSPGRLALLAALALAAALPAARGAAGSPRPSSVELTEGVRAALLDGREIELQARAFPGDGWIALSRRFLEDPEQWRLVAEANGGARGLIVGRWYRIPWDLLRPGYRALALRRLFPQDGHRDGSWVHRPEGAAAETYGQGLWQVALWFTGDGENFDELARLNGIEGPDIPDGAEVLVPDPLLLPAFRDEPSVADGDLVFSEDPQGPHASYRLKEGEAIYSAVVVRFTGRIDPEEVIEAAEVVARRSGITDVHAIPVGKIIKVPFDLLLVEYLPRSDPRRIEYELGLGEVAEVRMHVRARRLEGVHLVLDAGHGGKDRGAQRNGVWESDYVYDVMARIKRRLERETGAKVHPTTRDREIGYAVQDRRNLKPNGAEVILTDPEHRIRGGSSTTMGVNLRWHLANSVYRKLRKQGVDAERIVFITLHADSLHPSLRGAMIYVPGERYRRGTYGSSSKAYQRYREVREKPRVSISRSDRVRDEGLSRQFAEAVLAAFREQKLPVHEHKPVRDHVVRRGRAWAPAVLRGNLVPTKILLELANLQNRKDAEMLKDPAYREKLAGAVVQALEEYYR
jgi:N-acetylmuramoyl-L-alanine amidase